MVSRFLLKKPEVLSMTCFGIRNSAKEDFLPYLTGLSAEGFRPATVERRTVGLRILNAMMTGPSFRLRSRFHFSSVPSGGYMWDVCYFLGNLPSKGAKMSPFSVLNTAIPSETLRPNPKSPIFVYQFLITSLGLRLSACIFGA